MNVHRGARCGFCYWALYDGDWCQNPDCTMRGKSVGKSRIHLSNQEAHILITSLSSLDNKETRTITEP